MKTDTGVKKKTEKARKNGSWKLFAAGIFAVLFLAVWHYQGVKAGAIETQDFFMLSWYKALAVFGTAAVAAVGYFCLVKRKTGVETIFLTGGLSMGLMFLFVLQPLSAPDEIRHFMSAYRISNQMMGLPETDEYGQVYIREQDGFIVGLSPAGTEINEDGGNEARQQEHEILGQFLSQKTYHEIQERGLKAENGPENRPETAADSEAGKYGMISSKQIAVQTTPLAYVAPGLGITLARLLHLGGMSLLYMGRFFNLALFILCVWMALRRLPFGKPVMCAVALLPMTLHLAASFSYDTMINAIMFWFTAVCLDLAYSERNVRIRDVVLLGVLIGVAGPCKMVYAPVMGLCLLIPVRKFGGWRNWLISATVVFGAWFFAMIIVNTQIITVYATGTENYIGWAEETGYTLSGLLHRPGLVLQLFYNSLIWQAEYYHLTMIGAYLGQVDQVLDVPYIIVMWITAAILLLAFQRPGEETIYFSGNQKLWVWFLFAASAGATMFSMLLAWTPVTSLVISGVQGRYFIPLLPVLLMTLKNRWIVCTKNWDREILYLVLCADTYAVLRLFSIVSMRI